MDFGLCRDYALAQGEEKYTDVYALGLTHQLVAHFGSRPECVYLTDEEERLVVCLAALLRYSQKREHRFFCRLAFLYRAENPHLENLFRAALGVSRVICCHVQNTEFNEVSIPMVGAIDFDQAGYTFEYPEDFTERLRQLSTEDIHALQEVFLNPFVNKPPETAYERFVEQLLI